MLKTWLTRIAEWLLGPVARATELLADDEALLGHPPRALETMTPWRGDVSRHRDRQIRQTQRASAGAHNHENFVP